MDRPSLQLTPATVGKVVYKGLHSGTFLLLQGPDQ